MKMYLSYLLKSLFLGLILVQFLVACEASTDNKLAFLEQLIQAGGLDKISVLSVVQARYPSEESRDQDYEKFYKCAISYDGKIFTKIYVDALAKKISDENIGKAIDFYSSPLGKKIVRRQVAATYLMLGIPTNQKVEELSEKESSDAEIFLNTEVGRLIAMSSILQLPSVLDLFIEAQADIGKSCLKM